MTPQVTDPVLADLGERGRRLFAEVLAEHKTLGPRERVVLEEAARTADRLDQLDRLLRGDASTWARIYVPDHGDQMDLVVDKTMAEARQQQTTLARLLSELRQSLAPPASKPAPGATPAQPSGGGKLVDLTARIAALRGTPTG